MYVCPYYCIDENYDTVYDIFIYIYIPEFFKSMNWKIYEYRMYSIHRGRGGMFVVCWWHWYPIVRPCPFHLYLLVIACVCWCPAPLNIIEMENDLVLAHGFVFFFFLTGHPHLPTLRLLKSRGSHCGICRLDRNHAALTSQEFQFNTGFIYGFTIVRQNVTVRNHIYIYIPYIYILQPRIIYNSIW